MLEPVPGKSEPLPDAEGGKRRAMMGPTTTAQSSFLEL